MKARLQNYEVRSTQDGKITGRLTLEKSKLGEAKKYARSHSCYWKTRVVHVLSGNFPLHSFQGGKEIRLRADLIGEVTQ